MYLGSRDEHQTGHSAGQWLDVAVLCMPQWLGACGCWMLCGSWVLCASGYAPVHAVAWEGTRGLNIICPEVSAKTSRLGVGEFSGELMGMVHC